MKLTNFYFLVFFLLSSFLLCFESKAQNSNEVLDSANKAYQSGDYKTSAAQYEQLIQAGHNNGHLYYNLGNAYFRNNEYGKALAFYQKAKKLIPRDKDLNNNIKVLQEKHLPNSKTENIFNSLISSVSLIEIMAVFIAAWIITWTFLISGLFSKKRWLKYSGSLFTVISIISFTLVGLKYYNISDLKGVVTSKEASVKSGTDINAVNMFNINEGTILKVKERKDGWIKVELTSDKRGWIKSSSLEVI